MKRLAHHQDPWPNGHLREMYQRTLACWASDILRQQDGITWPGPDPMADYQDHDWRRLYSDNILDD